MMASCTLQLATTMSPTTRNRLQHAWEKSLESIRMARYLLTIHIMTPWEPKKRFGRLACAIHSHSHSSPEQTLCTSMMWVIMDVHSVCSGLECECEWIAQAKRPNLFFGSHGVIIWIVSRYRAIRIDSKDFSQACCKRLRVVGDIVVASCNVQLAIISKMNRSCVMSGST